MNCKKKQSVCQACCGTLPAQVFLEIALLIQDDTLHPEEMLSQAPDLFDSEIVCQFPRNYAGYCTGDTLADWIVYFPLAIHLQLCLFCLRIPSDGRRNLSRETKGAKNGT